MYTLDPHTAMDYQGVTIFIGGIFITEGMGALHGGGKEGQGTGGCCVPPGGLNQYWRLPGSKSLLKLSEVRHHIKHRGCRGEQGKEQKIELGLFHMLWQLQFWLLET